MRRLHTPQSDRPAKRMRHSHPEKENNYTTTIQRIGREALAPVLSDQFLALEPLAVPSTSATESSEDPATSRPLHSRSLLQEFGGEMNTGVIGLTCEAPLWNVPAQGVPGLAGGLSGSELDIILGQRKVKGPLYSPHQKVKTFTKPFLMRMLEEDPLYVIGWQISDEFDIEVNGVKLPRQVIAGVINGFCTGDVYKWRVDFLTMTLSITSSRC